jgi:hypothetical protein
VRQKAVVDLDRHCAEIVTQPSLLVGHLDGADVVVPVPSYPGWNVSQSPICCYGTCQLRLTRES